MSPNFSPGARLGRYQSKSQLGAGGMADVSLPQDTRRQRPSRLRYFRPGPSPVRQRNILTLLLTRYDNLDETLPHM